MRHTCRLQLRVNYICLSGFSCMHNSSISLFCVLLISVFQVGEMSSLCCCCDAVSYVFVWMLLD